MTGRRQSKKASNSKENANQEEVPCHARERTCLQLRKKRAFWCSSCYLQQISRRLLKCCLGDQMEGKLDSLISMVSSLTASMRSLEERLDTYEINLKEIIKRLDGHESQIFDISQKVNETVSTSTFDEMKARVAYLEELAENAQKEALQHEAYSKRLNLLIHGIDETTNTVWESKAETLATFNSFLKEGLDPDSITLVDAHRLPQRPIVKHGRRITRPIIIKLANALDKNKIMTNLKHLKIYKEARRSVQDSNFNSSINLANQSMKRSIYVIEHLPKVFYEQKKKTYANIQESTSIRSIHQVVNRKW